MSEPSVSATNELPSSAGSKGSFPRPSRTRDLIELIVGYGAVIGVIWSPEHLQRILTPLVLLLTLEMLLARRPSRRELGLDWRDFLPSIWIFGAAIALSLASVFVAVKLNTLHPLYKAEFGHIAGYILWTIYQQILLQDFFVDRLLRLGISAGAAVTLASTLFAAAHLPSPWLTAATLIWGIVSCALFRRYRSIWALGLSQGLLGLCFAICIPDALHHHLRVGLGYLRYHAGQPAP
jgi:MFS family permease